MRKGLLRGKVEEAQEAPKVDLRVQWQEAHLGQLPERVPWEELALGVAEYPELLRVIKVALRKEFLSAQAKAFGAEEADVWKRCQGMGRGFEIALSTIGELEAALAQKQEVDGDR